MTITGTVKFFNANKGFGFISPDAGGEDAFVHISAVERAGMATLEQNQRISYELEASRNGKMAACNLRKHRLTPDRYDGANAPSFSPSRRNRLGAE